MADTDGNKAGMGNDKIGDPMDQLWAKAQYKAVRQLFRMEAIDKWALLQVTVA